VTLDKAKKSILQEYVVYKANWLKIIRHVKNPNLLVAVEQDKINKYFLSECDMVYTAYEGEIKKTEDVVCGCVLLVDGVRIHIGFNQDDVRWMIKTKSISLVTDPNEHAAALLIGL
jgi:hypothetical protein